MKLPNKYISFKKSSLSKFTIVLEQLKNHDLSILDLYIRLVKGRTNQIFENTDELDKSYGDYFYLGADFYEAGKGTAMAVAGHVGTTVFDGTDRVETFRWTCSDKDVTQEEVDTLAQELTIAYGAYEKDADGVYRWYAAEDGTLGENDALAWISCGLNGDGVLVIEGSAE